MSLEAATMAPEWCLDPQPWFSCLDCGVGLYWVDLAHGELLICANAQCVGAGIEVPVWRAQQHREALGLDRPVSDAGWPRPVLEGRPVPYVTPVTAGHPWWRLTHGPRLLHCQNDWCCQVCGQGLEASGWVVVDPRGMVQTDAAMHERCLRLATAACPHLLAVAAQRAAQVRRADIHGDGRPLRDSGALTREQWTVPRLGAA
ncbi:hypothetical protein [Amycolatopsis sp. PS_44_ISF1]|uniref:hypothetical protein n=1 Tax=Amycolatopsis sp. PS_44_ISF1 TaxID=2974917 RepID=UPI0028E0828B|nr:hypothetical protein [Amycolatopsis sp. PS_44_ISF1]MDT8913475.1 hypothetical protein [Amycolatopsis sp. PS_44_ISF1]